MAATVSPDHILRELSNLWVDLGKQSEGVLRACSMTLVVLADESDDEQAIGETLAALMPEHPARTILIRLRPAAERTLTERVYSQCWMPFGQRRQICCEQIEITASDSALDDLASVVLPLAVADLPLIVWCRSVRLVSMREFRGIAAMAHKVIVDSTTFPDTPLPEGMLLGDLAWTRLTRWREMLSQVFENPKQLAELTKVARVRVTWSGTNRPLARYMAAWIANCLDEIGVHPEVTLAVAAEESLHVVLEGEGTHVELSREADRLKVTVNGLTNCTSLSQPTDYLLMREELGIVRRDPVFEAALARVRRGV